MKNKGTRVGGLPGRKSGGRRKEKLDQRDERDPRKRIHSRSNRLPAIEKMAVVSSYGRQIGEKRGSEQKKKKTSTIDSAWQTGCEARPRSDHRLNLGSEPRPGSVKAGKTGLLRKAKRIEHRTSTCSDTAVEKLGVEVTELTAAR